MAIPSSKRHICIDIDNVIARTDQVMRQVIKVVTHGRVNLEYDDILFFNYWECTDRSKHSISREEWSAVHNAFSQSLYLDQIEPVDGSQDALHALSDRFFLHIATSRLPIARIATIHWLERHRFPLHDLHFLRHGQKHISVGLFDVSVEDDAEQAVAFARTGFGTNFVISHPWNASVEPLPNVIRVAGWNDILTSLANE